MKNLATWCILAAVAVGWGWQDAAGQPKKTGAEKSKIGKVVGEVVKKAGEAAKNPYTLYGEEAALCMERFLATLADRVTETNKFWWTTMPKGKVAQEEWQAMANAMCEDLELYGRSAIDAAKDARKDKKCRATEADVAKLKAQVEKTIALADHVFRKKGLEVAVFRDTAQRAAETMYGFKSSMPIIVTRLVADLAYASDCAISIHKDLQSGQETQTQLDMDVRGMELARRSVQAVKVVGTVRRASLAVTMKSMAPEAILAACQKAIENWVPADLIADTLLTQKQAELVKAWPGLVEQAFGKSYAPVFEEGRKAVSPLVDATFHQIGLFKNTPLADLDKALDPYVNECQTAQEARKAFEVSQKDAQQIDKLATEDLAKAREAGKKAGELVRIVGDKIKNIQIKNLYEADRLRYQELGDKYAKIQVKHQDFEEAIKKTEDQLKAEDASSQYSRTNHDTPALKKHMEKIISLRMSLEMLRQNYERVGCDLEETAEEIATLRKEIRAD